MSAAGALIAMSAQRSGAATGDGQQHLLMLPADPPATALYEVVTSTVNDVGHLQRRSVHALRDTPATYLSAAPSRLAQPHAHASAALKAASFKSAFDQVHVASTANEPNLAKTPFVVWL
jgi:hypothetical protein